MSHPIRCQYYAGNIRNSQPLGITTFDRVLDGIANPKPHLEQLIQAIRQESDEGKRSALKTQLTAFTPCAIVSGRRRYANITEFTGIAMLDFDKLPDPQHAIQLKEYLFESFPWICAAWLSSSGKGVRAAVRIPRVLKVVHFKQHFAALEKTLGDYLGFDSAPKNCILPLFYSIDRKLLRRPLQTCELFTDIVIAQPPPTRPAPPASMADEGTTRSRALHAARVAIQRITGNGHPQLRAAAYALGGYVGSGILTPTEALQHLDTLIESNAYLAKKPSVYKRTARDMITAGAAAPLSS